MKILRQLSAAVLLSATLIGIFAVQALAQEAAKSGEPVESLKTVQALAYGLVLLGIVLGVMNVVRPGKRKGEKPKPGGA